MKSIKRADIFRRRTVEEKKNIRGLVFILPFIVGVIGFYGRFLLDSVRLSFSDLVFSPSGFTLTGVGMQNYQQALFKEVDYGRTLWESTRSMLFEIPVLIMFAMFIAVILNNRFRGRTFFRAVFFLPVLLATGILEQADANNLLLGSMSDPTALDVGTGAAGLLNMVDMRYYLLNMGIDPSLSSFILSLVDNIYGVVTKSGVQILIFLAGLQSISPSVYEAAYIEGADGWEVFWKITIPMMKPILFAGTIYTVIDSFTRSSNAVMSIIESIGFSQSRYGLAAAMTWVYSVVILALLGVVTALFFLRRKPKTMQVKRRRKGERKG